MCHVFLWLPVSVSAILTLLQYTDILCVADDAEQKQPTSAAGMTFGSSAYVGMTSIGPPTTPSSASGEENGKECYVELIIWRTHILPLGLLALEEDVEMSGPTSAQKVVPKKHAGPTESGESEITLSDEESTDDDGDDSDEDDLTDSDDGVKGVILEPDDVDADGSPATVPQESPRTPTVGSRARVPASLALHLTANLPTASATSHAEGNVFADSKRTSSCRVDTSAGSASEEKMGEAVIDEMELTETQADLFRTISLNAVKGGTSGSSAAAGESREASFQPEAQLNVEELSSTQQDILRDIKRLRSGKERRLQ